MRLSYRVALLVAPAIWWRNPAHTTTSNVGLSARAVDVPVVAADVCQPLSNPKRLPAVDALLDSTALSGQLTALDSLVGSELIVSVRMGDSPDAHVFDTTTAITSRGEGVAATVLASLRPNPKEAPQAFRLRIRRASGVQLTLERAMLCPPIALVGPGSRTPVTGAVSVRVTGPNGPLVTQPRDIQVRFRVDANGQISDVNIGRGSGLAELDRQIRDVYEQRRYSPAMLDGKPVAVAVAGSKVELVR